MFGTLSEEKGGLLLSDSTPGTELFSFRILLPKGSKAKREERERDLRNVIKNWLIRAGQGR
jgi:hypothetical protein